ncbi:hypothetical protein FRC00_009910, partial [Tulasnella sp. 408]
PEDETPATPRHGSGSPTRSENTSVLENAGPKDRWVLLNLDEKPNRVQSTPPSPTHPSPPRRGLTNTPASGVVSLVGARTSLAHELHAVVKPPRSGTGGPPSPDGPQEPTPGTPSFLNELPLQGHPEDDGFNELEESSGYSTPGNRTEMEDDQANADSDHELFHTPPESVDPPSQNSSFLLDDIGPFIISISEDPVRINGHFCDVFEGIHSTAGRVALKRPRIGGTGDDEEVIKLSETADALKYLHQNGVVHGDIKGTNILIDDN